MTLNKTRTPWHKRLAAAVNRDNYVAEIPEWAGDYENETEICVKDAKGVFYDLPVIVRAEREAGQNGGWDDPSWDTYYYAPTAWYYRDGRGWRRIHLDKEQTRSVCQEFADRFEG